MVPVESTAIQRSSKSASAEHAGTHGYSADVAALLGSAIAPRLDVCRAKECIGEIPPAQRALVMTTLEKPECAPDQSLLLSGRG